MEVSVLDVTTGEVGSMPAPEYGTPECVAFRKLVFDDIKKMLVTEGVERAMCAGTCAQAPRLSVHGAKCCNSTRSNKFFVYSAVNL